MKNKYNNIVTKLAEAKIRLDRGNSLIGWARNIFILCAAVSVLFRMVNVYVIGITYIVLAILIFLLGHLDINFFNLYQAEAGLNTGKYNPYFRDKKFKQDEGSLE